MNDEEKKNSDMIARRNAAISSILILIAVGTIIFKYLEHWSWINAFYFIVTTSATVGYGDITPKSETGKLLASIFILLIVPIVLYSFTIIAEISFVKRLERRERKHKE